MKITRRTDYAIHLIADLSEKPGSALGLRALAEKHNVTYAFARTVQQGLLNAGIIKTSRGINGGIMLAKPLHEITLLEVFEAAQNPLDVTFDSSDSPWCGCEGDGCVTDNIWTSTKSVLQEHLGGIKMHEVLGK